MTPRRIVRKRHKGWQKPENTVDVTRPGRWGNPFKVGEFSPLLSNPIGAEGAVGLFKDMLADPEAREICKYPTDLTALKGKNLMCWCPAGMPCHADVLLEIANSEGESA